jgi:hypothetical protein
MKQVIAYRRPSANNENGKMRNVILCEPTSSHSFASLIMLADYYRWLEVYHYSTLYNVDITNPTFNNCGSYQLLKCIRQAFNRKFLEKSALTCEYCNKKVFIAEGKSKRDDTATVDHRNPLHNECDWFDKTNLVVCCYKCNGKKGNMSYTEWLQHLTNISQKKL